MTIEVTLKNNLNAAHSHNTKTTERNGIKPADLTAVTETYSPFTEWYAHMFILDRKKQIIFVETQTLFSFSTGNVSRKDIRERLPEFFEKGLGRALYSEGASGKVLSKVMELCRCKFIFAKTKSRKIIGIINEFVKNHKFGFMYQGRQVDERDQCNRYMPILSFPNSSKKCEFPIDVFAKTLKEIMELDFTPQRKDFF